MRVAVGNRQSAVGISSADESAVSLDRGPGDWNEAMELVADRYRPGKVLPREKAFGANAQMRRAGSIRLPTADCRLPKGTCK